MFINSGSIKNVNLGQAAGKTGSNFRKTNKKKKLGKSGENPKTCEENQENLEDLGTTLVKYGNT